MTEYNNSINGDNRKSIQIEDDDNFLDDLLEEFTHSEEPAPIESVMVVDGDDNQDNLSSKSHQKEDLSTSKEVYEEPASTQRQPKRKSGLFKRMNITGDNDGEESNNSSSLEHTIIEKEVQNIENTEPASIQSEQEKPVRKRGSLLSRFTPEPVRQVEYDTSRLRERDLEDIDGPVVDLDNQDDKVINEPSITESNNEEVIDNGESKDDSAPIFSFNRRDKKPSAPIQETLVEESNDVEVEDISTPSLLEQAELTFAERLEISRKEDNRDNEDDFDSLLDDLMSEEEKDSRSDLDEEVEIPLNKKGMSEIKVTADGRTLEEMLMGKRKPTKKTSEVLASIKNNEEIIEVNGKKFSDDRYLKHAKRIKKQREEDEKRVSYGKKFIQRNAKLTEQEKIIMRNLNVSNEQLTKIMKTKELTAKQKKSLLGLGRYGAEKHFKGRKYKTTVGDSAILEYLTKFKFANTRIIRWINNDSQNRAWRKLNRLRESGLLESKSIIGIPDLFGATDAGVAVAGYALSPGLRPLPKLHTISSSMGVNYLAACLWFNSVNVLALDDFPANNRTIALQEDGRDRVRGEMLVSELEIRSSLGREISPQSTTMKTLGDERLYDVISSNVREEFEKWERNGKQGDSPEFYSGNEFMWILYPSGMLTTSYHVPDLVVKRERGPKGEPNSIAVELERYDKSNSDKYERVMLAYKLDEHLYKEVVWVTPNTRTARALQNAAEAVGFTRYRIIPILTETGTYNHQDIWRI